MTQQAFKCANPKCSTYLTVPPPAIKPDGTHEGCCPDCGTFQGGAWGRGSAPPHGQRRLPKADFDGTSKSEAGTLG